MQILLGLLLLSITGQGLATTLRNQVHSLVGKRLSSSMAFVNRINEVDDNQRNALHHAVMLGDLSLVEFFLANGANTRAEDKHGLIPLRYAEQLVAEQPTIERMQITSIVLEKTRGINKGGAKGWRPMNWSLAAGDYPRVVELRDRGADIFGGRVAISTYARQLAGRHNAVWLAEHLEDDRAIEILAEGAPPEYFPLAVGNGYRRFVQEMIARGVDINIKDKHGYSAAMRAAKAGRLDDLQTLIDNGAQIDSEVLFLAIHSSNPKLVEMITKQNVELVGKLIADLIYGRIHFPETFIGDALGGSKDKKKVHRVITKALSESSLQLPPLEAVARLQRLKEKTVSYPYLNLARPSLLQVAIDYGNRQDLQKIFDNMAEEKDFTANFGGLLSSIDKPSLNDGVLQDLLDVLRIAVMAGHTTAVQAVLDRLDNDDDSVYQELARGLAIANKNKDSDMVELLLEGSITAGFTKERLIDHANLLEKLDGTTLASNHNDLEVLVLLQAIEENDIEAIKSFVGLGLKINHKHNTSVIRRLFGKIELLELLVDGQAISLNDGLGLLYSAAWVGDYSAIDKIISLGGKTGIDEALRLVATHITPSPKYSFPSRDAFEKQVLITMRRLITAGANVNARPEDGKHPLLGAIRSRQVSRVRLLLEQEIVLPKKFIARALKTAKLSGADSANRNLTDIEKLLADNGLW